MEKFAEIMTAAPMINDPTARLNFMINENSKLSEEERMAEADVEARSEIISIGLETCKPEFDIDAATMLMESTALPENRDEKELAAVDFGKEYLVLFDTKDTEYFILYKMKQYFGVSKKCCQDVIRLINSERKRQAVSSIKKTESYATPAACYRDLPDNVNAEVEDMWEEYTLPTATSGEYDISAEGVFRTQTVFDKNTGSESEKTVCVSRSPVVICGKSTTEDKKHSMFKLRYCDAVVNETHEAWVKLEDLMNRNDLSKTFGRLHLNCTDTMTVEAMEYISSSISQFTGSLKEEYSATKCGWNFDKTKFIIGNRVITSKGIEPVLMVDNYKYNELNAVGDLGVWIEGVNPLLDFGITRFRIYDACTAFLGALLGIESHCTDHYGDTSEGKTLMAKVAVSMVGNPNEGLSCRADSTAKSMLANVERHSDLPFLIDETGMAKEDFPEVIYGLTNEVGRTKLDKEHKLSETELYRTTTLLTGEHTVRDVVKNAGQMVRVIEISDVVPTLDACVVKKAYDTIKNNYGLLVDAYIREVFKAKDSGELQNLYDECFNKLPDVDTKVEGRSKKFFALIMVAGILIERVFTAVGIENKNPEKIVSEYFVKCVCDNPIEMEHTRALRILVDWTESDYGSFTLIGDKDEAISEGHGFKRFGYMDEDYIDIIGSCLTDKLDRQNGIKPTKVKEKLAQLGIIAPKVGKNWQFSRNGHTQNGIRIYRQKAMEALGLIESPKGVENVLYNDEVRKVYKTVVFLTEINGQAQKSLIEQILNTTDCEYVLSHLAKNGKVMKVNEGIYKGI